MKSLNSNIKVLISNKSIAFDSFYRGQILLFDFLQVSLAFIFFLKGRRCMARPLRLEFEGALYHLTSRGNGRQDIFEDANDREIFLSILGDVCRDNRWVCYAYCLMPNHYHLLVETGDSTLSKGMRQLNGIYTQRFNRIHLQGGHVFQGRFKAILVDKKNYLLELARYIVLNPVRAKLVSSVGDWVWSSYRATVELDSVPEWLDVKSVLASFGHQKNKAIGAYALFVSKGRELASPWSKLKNQIFLGDEAFVNSHLRLIDKDRNLSEVPARQKRALPEPLSAYEASCANRNAAIYGAYKSGGYSMKDIGEYFNLHYSRVSRILAEEKMKNNFK
jgi:putative transposase